MIIRSKIEFGIVLLDVPKTPNDCLGNTKVSENAPKELVTVSAVKANRSWHTQKILFIESE